MRVFNACLMLSRRHRVSLLLMLVLGFSTHVSHAQSAGSGAQRPTPRLTPRLRPPAQQAHGAERAPQDKTSTTAATPAGAPTRPPSETPPPLMAASKAQQAPKTAAARSSGGPQVNLYPPLLPAYGKEPPPPGYIERTRVNTPLVVSGAVTFSVTYIASLAIAGRQKFKNGTGALAVPLLGPWLAIAGRNINCDITVDETTGVDGIDEDIEESTDDAAKCFAKEAGTIAVMTGMGIGQIIGASLLLAGILDRRHYYLRADLGPVSFTPVFDRRMMGLYISGHL